jgi:hypothetical protein
MEVIVLILNQAADADAKFVLSGQFFRRFEPFPAYG